MASRRLLFASIALLTAGCPADDASGDTDAATGGTDATTSSTTTSSTTSTSSTSSTTTSSTTVTPTTEPTGTGPETGSSGSGSTDTGSSDSGGSTSTGIAGCEGMSFFATSVGSGDAGGNLGGLDGADANCQALAAAAGQDACTWRAYLSTADEDARDRIGEGPWENANGDVVALTVQALHDDGLSNGRPQHIFDETGAEIPANEHDILTGTQEDGTYLEGATCDDWTASSPKAGAGVGHSDIPNNPQFSRSWVEAHVVDGCTPQNLASTNGGGRTYCFAL